MVRRKDLMKHVWNFYSDKRGNPVENMFLLGDEVESLYLELVGYELSTPIIEEIFLSPFLDVFPVKRVSSPRLSTSRLQVIDLIYDAETDTLKILTKEGVDFEL